MPPFFLTIFEIIYLIYMFYFFKTTFEIHHPLEKSVVSLGEYFKHPIRTGYYESKICLFGKYAIVLLLLFLTYRLCFFVPNTVNLIVMIIVSTVSLMNLNAFLYIIPYIMIELYFILNIK